KPPLRVVDFGGAFGTAYFLTRQRLPALEVRWAVVESATFAGLAQRLDRTLSAPPDFRFLTEMSDSALHFFDGITNAMKWLGEVDLVYSSGALQYTPDPEGFLAELVATRPRTLALLRCALSRGSRVVTVQSSRLKDNGPGPLPEGFMDRRVSY